MKGCEFFNFLWFGLFVDKIVIVFYMECWTVICLLCSLEFVLLFVYSEILITKVSLFMMVFVNDQEDEEGDWGSPERR